MKSTDYESPPSRRQSQVSAPRMMQDGAKLRGPGKRLD
jgi:hypothetical protein